MNGKPAKNLSAEALDVLREAVRPYYTESRYLHALGVETEAAALGALLLPERVNALRAAALLHDITKKFDFEKQLQCCLDFGIILQSPCSPEVLHAITGAAVAGKDFADFTDEEILLAIRYHTTGHSGMTPFESVIFIADYIEPGRTHEACVALRDRFHSALQNAERLSLRQSALTDAVLRALDNTISHLVQKEAVIDSDTISARSFFLAEKAKVKKGKSYE